MEQSKQIELQQTLLAEQADYIEQQRKNSLWYKLATFTLGALAISLLVEK